MRRKLMQLVAGTTLMLALVGCPPTASGSVFSVTISGGDRTLTEGASTALTAVVQATGNANTAVTWTSSAPGIASIDDDGTLTALAPGTATITAISIADPTKNDGITVTVDPPAMLRWTRQFGTSSDDVAHAITIDAYGAIYTAGYTDGALEGPSTGRQDAFVRSYDRDGSHRWTRQFGTSESDLAFSVATDADGHVYTAGFTAGDLGGANAGDLDAFVRSYDANGDLRWTRQFGTGFFDAAYAIATDAHGNVYVAGTTDGAIDGANAGGGDAFVRSYDTNGSVRWTRQFGTSGFDSARGIATDADGNVIVTGSTRGDLGGANAGGGDAFVRSYDTNGSERWTRQFGTNSDDIATGVAIAADGAIYVAGYTVGALVGSNAGAQDAFVRSLDGNGALRWTQQFGTSSDDQARGIAADAAGNVYVAGYTFGALDGLNAGLEDAFVRSFDSSGSLRTTRQFGSSADDQARGIAADADGNVYTAGYTFGSLDGANVGAADAFVRAYAP